MKIKMTVTGNLLLGCRPRHKIAAHSRISRGFRNALLVLHSLACLLASDIKKFRKSQESDMLNVVHATDVTGDKADSSTGGDDDASDFDSTIQKMFEDKDPRLQGRCATVGSVDK